MTNNEAPEPLAERTPAERLAGLPEQVQAALWDLALSAIDTTREEKLEIGVVLATVCEDPLPDALSRSLRAQKAVLASVQVHIAQQIVDDLLADDGRLLRAAFAEGDA